MTTIPKDPMILFSFINMKLRDQYASLELLCEDLQLNQEELIHTLAEVGFEYNAELNKFW